MLASLLTRFKSTQQPALTHEPTFLTILNKPGVLFCVSARRIQNVYRRWCRVRAAVKIQCFVRSFVCRSKFRASMRSIVMVQAISRGVMAARQYGADRSRVVQVPCSITPFRVACMLPEAQDCQNCERRPPPLIFPYRITRFRHCREAYWGAAELRSSLIHTETRVWSSSTAFSVMPMQSSRLPRQSGTLQNVVCWWASWKSWRRPRRLLC